MLQPEYGISEAALRIYLLFRRLRSLRSLHPRLSMVLPLRGNPHLPLRPLGLNERAVDEK